MVLTDNEILELQYMQKLGYKYIARDDNFGNCIYAYISMPIRQDNDTWYPIDEMSDECVLGDYKFLTWEDEPMSIDKLLADNIKPIHLVYPNNIED